jgi:competence protein ComEA
MLQWLQTFFEVRRWEAIALVCTLVAIILIASLNYAVPLLQDRYIDEAHKVTLTQLQQSIDSASAAEGNTSYQKQGGDGSNIKPFNFDPNTLTREKWLAMGFCEKQVRTILNYREKGGKFYDKQDVQKMYSISEAEYQKIEAFIAIPAREKSTYTKRAEPTTVDINTCDTAALVQLPGIGSYTAFKVVELRQKLGGFVTVTQLAEAGVSEENLSMAKKYIYLNAAKVKKIALNTISFQELRTHPYCNENMALAICKYRKANGSISSLSQISSLPDVDPHLLRKIWPYVVLQ